MRRFAVILAGLSAFALSGCWTYMSREPAFGSGAGDSALAPGYYCTVQQIVETYEIDANEGDCADFTGGADAPAMALRDLHNGLHLVQLSQEAPETGYLYGFLLISDDGALLVDDAATATVLRHAEEIGGLTVIEEDWGGVLIDAGAPEAMLELFSRSHADRLAEIVEDGVIGEDEAIIYFRVDDLENAAPTSEEIQAVAEALHAALLESAAAHE